MEMDGQLLQSARNCQILELIELLALKPKTKWYERRPRWTMQVIVDDTPYWLFDCAYDLSKHVNNAGGVLITFLRHAKDHAALLDKIRVEDMLKGHLAPYQLSGDLSPSNCIDLLIHCIHYHTPIDEKGRDGWALPIVLLLGAFCDCSSIKQNEHVYCVSKLSCELVERKSGPCDVEFTRIIAMSNKHWKMEREKQRVDAAKFNDAKFYLTTFILEGYRGSIRYSSQTLERIVFENYYGNIPVMFHKRIKQSVTTGIVVGDYCSKCWLRHVVLRYRECEVGGYNCRNGCDSRCITNRLTYDRLACDCKNEFTAAFAMVDTPAPVAKANQNAPAAFAKANQNAPAAFAKANQNAPAPAPSAPPDDDLADLVMCQICMERQKNVALGCAHTFCSVCVGKLSTCPNCRVAISAVIPILL
jgi:hypothetical protein